PARGGLSRRFSRPGSAWFPVYEARLLHLGLRLFLGKALLEHHGEVDRVDHQRRKTAITGALGDDLAREREEQPRALDEQKRRHMLLREAVDAENSAIDQFDVEEHFAVVARLGGERQG